MAEVEVVSLVPTQVALSLPDVERIPDEELPAAILQVQALLFRTVALHEALVARLVSSRASSREPQLDRRLSMKEAAELLGMSRSWLEKHWRELPFASKEGGRVVFSALGLQKYLRTRQGRGA